MLEEAHRTENANRYGLTQLLTSEEKKSYRLFGQRVHTMNDQDLMKLNSNLADALTSEMKDIVAFEIRLREVELLKKLNIDPNKAFTVENNHPDPGYAEDLNGRELQSLQSLERERMAGMDEELLNRSKEIIDNTFLPVDQEKLNKKNGGGINAMWQHYLIEDDGGKIVKVNNGKIQEMFRKRYIQRLSDATGIDYTSLDASPDIDEPDNGYSMGPEAKITTQRESLRKIDFDDYEDD